MKSYEEKLSVTLSFILLKSKYIEMKISFREIACKFISACGITKAENSLHNDG